MPAEAKGSPWDRFTECAKRVVVFAQWDAEDREENYVASEHLLAALLQENGSVGARAINRLGASRVLIHADLELHRTRVPRHQKANPELNRSGKAVIDAAIQQAMALGHDFIGTGHLLLGLLWHDRRLVARLLLRHGVNGMSARRAVIELHGSEPDEPCAVEDSWTDRANRVLKRAEAYARERGENNISPDHLLYAILQDEGAIGAQILLQQAVARTGLEAELVRKQATIPPHGGESCSYTRSARWAFDLGDEEARTRRHDKFTTGHLLLGLVTEGRSLASELLGEAGVDREHVRHAVAKLYADEPLPPGETDQPEADPGRVQDDPPAN